jgi:glycosyltransferase involved in cell wall biosynthesis
MNVLIITNIISPYRIPLFNSLSCQKDLNLMVCFMDDIEFDREWKIYYNEIEFKYKVLKKINSTYLNKKKIYINTKIWRELKAFKPDSIINIGYGSLANIVSYIYSKIKKTNFIIWESYHKKYYPKNIITRCIQFFMVKGADAFVTYSKSSYELLRSYRIHDHKIFIGSNTIDMDYYDIKSREFKRSNEFLELKNKYFKHNILYVGQFIERKNVIDILNIAKKMNNKEIGFIIIGSGELENEYKQFIKNNSLDNVIIENYKQRDELIRYYAISDILILPSKYEIWGLVINEAIACNVIPICSFNCGCSEIILNNINGFVYRINSSTQVIEYIKTALKEKELIAENLQLTKKNISLINYVNKFLEALEYLKK